MNNPFTFRTESIDHFPEAEEFDDEWMDTSFESGVTNDLLSLDREFEWEDERTLRRRLLKQGPSARRRRPLSKPQPPFRRTPPRPGKGPKRRVIVRPTGRRVLPLAPSPCICPTHGSEYIRWVQSSLNHLMGLNLLVNGVMNPATRKSLRDFQQQRGLQTDGIAGPDTKRALLDARGGGLVTDTIGTTASTNMPEPVADSELFEFDAEELEAPLARPIVRHGSRGVAVIELQRRLTALGFTPGAADGIFGSGTESAVKSFQRSRGITADGIVGSQTWSQLYGPAPSPTAPPAPSTTSPNWSLPADVRAAGDARSVRYDSPPAWANGANCTSYTDGAAELRRHILATFPGITSIGGYNCRANSANPSETSVHGVGRALDIMIRPIGGRANSAVGDPIANWLVRTAEAIGVQYIIWNRMRWSGSRSPRVAPYGGPNPHTDHIHVELNLDGARRRTPWFQRRTVGQHEFDTNEFEAPLARPKLQQGSSGASVIQLQKRLTSLGFNPGAADGIFGLQTKSAVKAFQSARNITTDGIVGSHTWEQLYGPAPALKPGKVGPVPGVDTPLPKSGIGFVSAKPQSRQYGLAETIQALKEIGCRWNALYPLGPSIQISDISKRGGGSLPPHKSHRIGNDADIRFIKKDGTLGAVNPLILSEKANFDKARTQDLVDIIRANGVLKVHRLWVNTRIGLRNVNGDENHNNHMHVRFCVPARYDLGEMKRAAMITAGTFTTC